jgi:hypothetical protein
MEHFASPCNVGLPLDDKHCCPFFDDSAVSLDSLDFLQQIVRTRAPAEPHSGGSAV